MDLIIENVRCFSGEHKVHIAPLTILIGENSSGKSTFLAMLSVVGKRGIFPFSTTFNEPPFELGSFDTIVTNGGKQGQVKSFKIGYENIIQNGNSESTEHKVLATYSSKAGKPFVSELFWKEDETYAAITFPDGNTIKLDGVLKTKNQPSLSISSSNSVINLDFNDITSLLYNLLPYKDDRDYSSTIVSLNRLIVLLSRYSAIPIAPIRTKPKRTYDQLTDTFSPEGGHIPYLLARIFSEESDKQKKELLERALEKFGEESGLFKKISVNQLGQKMGDPFQIMLTINNRQINLLDVGYGISQSLPIIVESILAPPTEMLLLQQPEVHLHPQAQAALGTFFIDLVAKNKRKEVVVETHSDFIVDRIRFEVAQGNIKKEDVSILFFSKPEYETKIYQLHLDDNGNILNAPPEYRQFFLSEELRILNRVM